jgi:hypothetical protein
MLTEDEAGEDAGMDVGDIDSEPAAASPPVVDVLERERFAGRAGSSAEDRRDGLAETLVDAVNGI